MKKQLLCLLLTPFLLIGCGGKGNANKAGEKGDPVLTQEEIDKIVIKKNASYESGFEKVGTLTIPSTATSVTYSFGDELVTYINDDTFVLASFMNAKTIFTIPEISSYDSYLREFDWWSADIDYKYATGLEPCKIITRKVDPETLKDIYHIYLIDSIGNKLLDLEKDYLPDIYLTGHIEHEVSEDGKYLRYAVGAASYYDQSTNKMVESLWKYSRDFKQAVKISDEDFYPQSVTWTPDSYKFSITKGDVVSEYSVILDEIRPTDSSFNGYAVHVSHMEGENKVEKDYYLPTTSNDVKWAFLDHHLIYQNKVKVEAHDQSYDAYDRVYNSYFHVDTYVVDLVSGESNKVNFPYIIKEVVDSDDFIEGQPIEISKYACIEMYEIKDRVISNRSETYVVDSNLVLHDNLTHQVPMYKVGSHYFGYGDNSIYDANRNRIGSLNYEVRTAYEKCLEIANDGLHGIVDESGNYLVKPLYNGARAISGDVLLLEGFSANPREYFNINTLEVVTPKFDEDADVTEIKHMGLFLVKADGSEGSKNKLYRLGTELESFDASIINITLINENDFFDTVIDHAAVSYVDADGNIVNAVYRSYTSQLS